MSGLVVFFSRSVSRFELNLGFLYSEAVIIRIDEEENSDTEPPKTEKSKESFAIDADVIKGIQAQIASLTQRGELKKVGMTSPYLLEWD